MATRPAKGSTCATATKASVARKKIKARTGRNPKSLHKTKIGKKTAFCTNVVEVKSK
ncbi:MAG: hypothetical protein Q7R49_00245 [Candidatus Daviesbacteria bacterium]|nr:hypothetical protein [Candidatus Daviesbacteria bacterium]